MKKQLTQKELKRQLYYNPETGVFNRKVSNSSSVNIGDVAGSLTLSGYVLVGVDSKRYLAHRLAWLYVEGFFPVNIQIDHINRIKTDNRWCNLRVVSPQCNARNSNKQYTNTSGVTGVYWNKQKKKWFAFIGSDNKRHWAGYSKDFNEAVLLRLAAEQCLNWSSCDSKTSAYLYAKNNGLIKSNKSNQP